MSSTEIWKGETKAKMPHSRGRSPEKYPVGMLPSLRTVSFVCPLCKGDLDTEERGFFCAGCNRLYTLHAGIPDFRVFPDPYLNLQEDRERTEIVLVGLDGRSLEQLLEYYWTFSDITPPDLRVKFVRSVKLGEERAKRSVAVLDEQAGKASGTITRLLEIGSGAGGFLAAASERYEQVVGIDIAMRWLHVSRRRFMDMGEPVPPLVCCCAEFLPFPAGSFDMVAMNSTLEFVKDQEMALSETSRVLVDGGSVYINAANRYSLATDPFSYLWGVGYLPRSMQAGYVYRRRGAVYKARVVSRREFGALLDGKFSSSRFLLPDVSEKVLDALPASSRLQVKMYRILKRVPAIRKLLELLGPGWEVILKKGNV